MRYVLMLCIPLLIPDAVAQGQPFVSTCKASASFTASDRVDKDHFGASFAVHGDWNGDGYRDLVVGGMIPATYTTYTRVWVFLGSAQGPVAPEVIVFKGVPGDLFGWDVCFLPDLNGDGRDEIAVGAPNYEADRGRVYVFYGRQISAGPLGPDLDAATNANLIIEGTTPGGRFGLSIAASRNINGENLPDLIVGAPGGRNSDSAPNNYQGWAYVFYGPNLTAMALALACATPPCNPPPQWATALSADVALSGVDPRDRFGNSVAVVGNIDGIGGCEFIVGAPELEIDCPVPITDPSCPPVVNGNGYARVYRGATGQQLVHLAGSQYGEAFGWSVAGMVDIGPIGPLGNPDGIQDFLIGAFRSTTNLVGGGTQAEAGRVVVYSGDTLQPIPALFDSLNGTKLVGERPGDWLGWSVAGSGDLAGDNVDDVLAGAMRATQRTGEAACLGGQLNGAVYIFDGSNGHIWKTLVGELPRDRLGWDVDAAVLDGDTIVDVVSAGMAWTDPQNPTTTEVGKAYLYLGHTLQLLP